MRHKPDVGARGPTVDARKATLRAPDDNRHKDDDLRDDKELNMPFWTAICLILVLSAVGLTYEIAAGRVLAPFFRDVSRDVDGGDRDRAGGVLAGQRIGRFRGRT